jgi:hypothetical protein
MTNGKGANGVRQQLYNDEERDYAIIEGGLYIQGRALNIQWAVPKILGNAHRNFVLDDNPRSISQTRSQQRTSQF